MCKVHERAHESTEPCPWCPPPVVAAGPGKIWHCHPDSYHVFLKQIGPNDLLWVDGDCPREFMIDMTQPKNGKPIVYDNTVRYGIDPTVSPLAREIVDLIDAGHMSQMDGNYALGHQGGVVGPALLDDARAKRQAAMKP